MNNHEKILLAAVIGITILGVVGLFKGYDGESYGFTVAAIAGLAGYQIGRAILSNNKK